MAISSGTRLGRYEIRSLIGKGGMGEVYLARDSQLDRAVALKVLPPEIARDRRRMRRFKQEARTASALKHPNAAHIYEIGDESGISFIAMEFIEGETLRQRLKSTRLKIGEVLEVGTQIAAALSAAHQAGITHRDIKPENIIVSGDGFAKVLDFGLAKITEHEVAAVDTTAPTRPQINTEPGVVIGTVSYMSPEQARGLAVDARTDIWSLGVVLYEMVAGCLPFVGTTNSEVLAAILDDKDAMPLARYAREVPLELERIVTKALRKDREQRYQGIRDMLLDLKSLKQEMEFEAKLERSTPPELKDKTTARGRQLEVETVTEPAAHPTGSPSGAASDRRPFSAERLKSAIKLQKTGAVAAAIAAVIAIVTAAYLNSVRSSRAVINSMAVLPFVNASADPNMEYLSDGITEGLINSLSQLPDLKVMSRSSVFRYKGREADALATGRELGVQAVLMGRVMQRGDALSISIELVDARDNSHLWGEQYDSKLSEVLAIQREIPKEISEKLRLRLTTEQQKRLTKRYTENTEAYQAYLKGRYYWNKRTDDGLRKSIEYFQQAIDLDPGYALAYAGLASSYVLASFPLPPKEKMPKAKAAAIKALEIDNTLAEAHTALARARYLYDRDWPESDREFKQAIELNPNYETTHHWRAEYLASLGRMDEAIAEAKRAQELDPLSLVINWNVGHILYLARRYDQAIEQYRKTLELEPRFNRARGDLIEAYEEKGMYEEAIAEAGKQFSLSGGNPERVAALQEAYRVSGEEGYWRKQIDLAKEEPKTSRMWPLHVAQLYARVGEKDQAFAWLEKADEEQEPFLVLLKVEPGWDSLRSDPRFTDLVRRAGLTP